MVKVHYLLLIVIFIGGAAVRSVDVWRGVDQPVWREADMASVARNYARGDMNILNPQIDWRGDGPGYVEMEFPVYPWSIAVLYKIFGADEAIGRYLSYLISLATMLVFVLLCYRLLPPVPALAAFLFFSVSPILVQLASALQPDGAMFFAYLFAVYAFVRCLEQSSARSLVGGCVAASAAVLLKAPAAHLAVAFLAIGWRRNGRSWILNRRTILLAAVALLVPLAWYWYARGFWSEYGNSLGLSNQYHWIGFDMLAGGFPMQSLLRLEVFCSWLVPGTLLAMLGLTNVRLANCRQVAAMWYAAVVVFYVAALRTTAADWAIYYHVFSVGPAALLTGLAVDRLVLFRPGARVSYWMTCGLALLAAASFAYVIFAPVYVTDCGAQTATKFAVTVIASGVLVMVLISRNTSFLDFDVLPRLPIWRFNRVVYALALALALALVLSFPLAVSGWSRSATPDLDCAERLSHYVPAGALIVASGGLCADEFGKPAAFNDSALFYWLDTQGWNLCAENENIAEIEKLKRKGARYYIVNRSALETRAQLFDALQARYLYVAECRDKVLFDLDLVPLSADSTLTQNDHR